MYLNMFKSNVAYKSSWKVEYPNYQNRLNNKYITIRERGNTYESALNWTNFKPLQLHNHNLQAKPA